jgi:hypothetical protein
VTAWRARLTMLQAQSEASAEIYANAKSANSANRCATSTPAEAIGAIGTNGTGIDLAKDPWAALQHILAAAPAGPTCSTSWLQSIAGSIAGALADGARRERDADGYLALVRPDGRRLTVAQRTVDELAEAGLLSPLPQEQDDMQRPPSWSRPKDVPPPGAWCGCCGRFDRSGGRWWREAEAPSGWCCWTCHPPGGRPDAAVVEVRT